jgi:diguanylate cyclase (GGDEF)-like protein
VSLIGQPLHDGDAVAPPSPQLTDPLTGLLTRDGLIAAASHRTGPGAAVIFVDFDNFRRINAAHGRSAGNAVLADLAQRLREVTPGDALVARTGGDDFIVCLPDGGAAHAQIVAQQLLEKSAGPVLIGRQKIRLTAAIGIAEIDASNDFETVLHQSEVAMSHAKHHRNHRQIRIYSSHMSDLAVERMTIEAELRDALALEQLRLFYQPVVDLATGHTYEVEALLRWQHPERGLLEPGAFLPMAEQLGFMSDIGRWVLLMACRQGRQWQDAHPGVRQVMVAVNLSPAQVRDPNLPGDVRAALEETGFRPSLLRLEISESVTHEDLDPAILAIHALRDLGVLISLDDFGAGYAGWSFLQHCPIDGIKIDRSLLVARDEESLGHPGMVEAVMAFATQLGIPVGVEGIERIEQAEAMRKLGILTAQGFYFAHPEPAEIIAPSLAFAREFQCFL